MTTHRILCRLALALACASLLASGPAFAGPSGIWKNISVVNAPGAATAFDAQRGRMLVFGGDGTSVVHAVSTSGVPVEWTNLEPTGTPPSPRSDAAIAYDPTGDRLIVFGGRDAAGVCHNDLWQLTLSGTPAWSPITATGSVPSPRAHFGACFDPDRILLVVCGGLGSNGALVDGNQYQIDLGQPAPAWSVWSPGPNGPGARSDLRLCDVPSLDGLVAYGGDDGSGPQSDAFTMRFGSHVWTALSTSGDLPLPASQPLTLYDTEDDLMLLWGGNGADDEVRTLDPVSGVWTIRPNENWQSAPAGHTRPIGVWVTGHQQMLVLDGDDSNQLVQFVFSLDNSYWQIWLDPNANAEVRAGATFVRDKIDDVAILFGGRNVYEQAVANSWGYSLSEPRGWDEVFFTTYGGDPPSPRSQAVAVWDDARDRMITFSGVDGAFHLLNDVHALNIAGWFSAGVPGYTWDALTPTGTAPSARTQSAGIYDPAGDRVLIFGGLDAGGYPRADLWQLSLAGTPAWTRLALPGGPSGRCGHTALYDAPKHRMIVFGGEDSLGGSLDSDVWALQLPSLTWSHLIPTGTVPPGRYMHTAVFDSRRERMLVMGGTVASGDERDVYALDLSTATPAWSKLTPATLTGAQPVKRYEHAAVYDSTNDRMLVYGGLLPPLGVFGNPFPLKDLWSLQFDFSGATTAVDPPVAHGAFAIESAWPNPARAASHVAFTLPVASHVRATVFDIAGRAVRVLADEARAAGRHELTWDGVRAGGGRAVAGLYFVRIESGSGTATQKIVLAE